jgi:hypothetical protein
MQKGESQKPAGAERFADTVDALAEDFNLSVRYAYDLLKEPGAPKPIIIGKKCVRYVRSEWREFLLAKRDQSQAQAEPPLRLASDVRKVT